MYVQIYLLIVYKKSMEHYQLKSLLKKKLFQNKGGCDVPIARISWTNAVWYSFPNIKNLNQNL